MTEDLPLHELHEQVVSTCFDPPHDMRYACFYAYVRRYQQARTTTDYVALAVKCRVELAKPGLPRDLLLGYQQLAHLSRWRADQLRQSDNAVW